MYSKPAILSLFCGCGGFDLGFTEAGFEVALALDIDLAAVASYNHNHGNEIAKQSDLAVTTGHEIIEILRKRSPDLKLRGVVGGPPCQSFSNGNVHPRENDVRHSLPKKYAAILKDLNRYYDLDFFVFENVQGISYKRHRAVFSEFKSLFEDAGFRLTEGLLDALHFGVPQRRPRVFVVGVNKTKYPDFHFPFPTGNLHEAATVRSAIGKLPPPAFFSRKLDPDCIPHHPNHWTMKPKSKKFKNGFLKKGHTRGRSFRVLSWNNPSWAVAYGNREIHIHPNGKRRLSVYEAMMLQGFPKTYQLMGNLSEQVRQVSNAVPWQVGEALARKLLLFLTEG
jgi:DNA (cytosine-5)-methyltransferase 1